MSELMREIEEDIRRQKLKTFWDENRAWIIATVILSIVATAGITIWRGHVQARNQAATARLFDALQAPGGIVALTRDEEALAALGRPAHRALARLAAADRLLIRGEPEEAIAELNALAADRKAEADLRDLGLLYATALSFDTASADTLRKNLSRLTGVKGVWRHSALELRALLEAREGHLKEAIATLALITGDPSAPQDARTRAFSLREFYQADLAAAGAGDDGAGG